MQAGDGRGMRRGRAIPKRVKHHHQLYAAALRALRRSDGRREHPLLRRPVRRPQQDARRAPTDCCSVRHEPVSQAPGGQSFRRNEAEARTGLRADPHAARVAARRADQRRRPGFAARILGDALFAASARASPSSIRPPTSTRPSDAIASRCCIRGGCCSATTPARLKARHAGRGRIDSVVGSAPGARRARQCRRRFERGAGWRRGASVRR